LDSKESEIKIIFTGLLLVDSEISKKY